MPKGREVLDELRSRAESTAVAYAVAQKECAERQDAFTVAEALEGAITAVFKRERLHAIKTVGEALTASLRWDQWRTVLAEVRLPDKGWLTGVCLMDPSVYGEMRQRESELNEAELLAKAVLLVDPREDLGCAVPALEVVEGRFCPGQFRAFCVHFAS